MNHFDVVVVGMGPVGATIACLLARQGLTVAILDRELGIYDKPRAIVLDHEALRVLQHCRLDPTFFASVSPHTGTDFVGVQGQLIKLFDPKAPPFELGWPPNVMFIQPELEEALSKAMDGYPSIHRQRGVAVTDIQENGDSAILTLRDRTGGEQQIEASWVVGADGANSFVRETAKLPVDDKDFAEWWIVVDAWKRRDTPLPRKTTQYCQPTRPATFVVGPRGLLRWEIKLLADETPDTFQSEESILDLLSSFVDVSAIELWRSAVYRFRAVVATQWRRGRLVIAGDAAHTMPPFLAQGLCAGIRDAAVLAWRLAHIVRNGSAPDLLDGYEVERKPHVSEIIDHAKSFGLIIGELDEGRAAERDALLEEQLRTGAVPTERQAFVPPLRGGLIDTEATLAGALFVQPRIRDRDGDGMVLLDDVVGPDFLAVSSDPAMLHLDADLAARWRAVGGRLLLVGRDSPDELDEGIEWLDEAEGEVARWLDRSGVSAAIVRPDRYVYGATSQLENFNRMMGDVLTALSPH